MAAGMTAQTIALERLDELGRGLVRALGEQLLQLHVRSVLRFDGMPSFMDPSARSLSWSSAGVFGTWTAHHLRLRGLRRHAR